MSAKVILFSKSQIQAFDKCLKSGHLNLLMAPSLRGKSTLIDAWLHKSLSKKGLKYVVQIDALDVQNRSTIDPIMKMEAILCHKMYQQLQLNNPEKLEALDSSIIEILDHVALDIEEKGANVVALPAVIWHHAFSQLLQIHTDWVIHIDHAQSVVTSDKKNEVVTWLKHLAENKSVKYVLLSVNQKLIQFDDMLDSLSILNHIRLPEISLSRWKKKVLHNYPVIRSNGEVEPLFELLFEEIDAHPAYLFESIELLLLNAHESTQFPTVQEILNKLIERRIVLFRFIAQSLSKAQRHFLVACALEEPKLFSKSVIERYELGTSANVARMKHLLIAKEIIHEIDQEIKFTDPLMKYYFKQLSVASFQRLNSMNL